MNINFNFGIGMGMGMTPVNPFMMQPGMQFGLSGQLGMFAGGMYGGAGMMMGNPMMGGMMGMGGFPGMMGMGGYPGMMGGAMSPMMMPPMMGGMQQMQMMMMMQMLMKMMMMMQMQNGGGMNPMMGGMPGMMPPMMGGMPGMSGMPVLPPMPQGYPGGMYGPGNFPPMMGMGSNAISPTGNRLADIAGSMAGRAFKPGQTCRCADFVSTMIRQSGAAPPGFRHEVSCNNLQKYGTPVHRNQLQPGDVVYFGNTYRPGQFTHVGIYLGDGKFVHRPTANAPVKIDNLNSGYYASKYTGARRLNV